jgi:hypothetical protein
MTMKTKVAMMISLAGVLVAGSAAALVNTQVLDSSSSASPLAIDNAQATVPTVPAVTVATTVPTPVVVVDSTIAPTTLPTVAATGTQAAYLVGDSGTVTLDTAGDRLTIVDVTPAAGWIITKSETEDATNVEVKFQAGTTEVEFHANLLFGVVTTSVEAKDESIPDNSITDNSVTGNSVEDSGHHGGDDDGDDHGGDDD